MDIAQSKKTYPAWVGEFARKYYSRTITQYILHGNIYDYVQVKDETQTKYLLLREFLRDETSGASTNLGTLEKQPRAPHPSPVATRSSLRYRSSGRSQRAQQAS